MRKVIARATCVVVLSASIGQVQGGTIFTEDFDSLAPGTQVTETNLPGWNLVGDGAMETTDVSAASSPNSLHGLPPNRRGTMFHSVDGVTEVRFGFFRRDQTTSPSYITASADVGLVSTETIDFYNGFTGPRVHFFTNAVQRGDINTALAFFVRDTDSAILSRWDLFPLCSDDTWYEGLIRLEPDNTITLGFRPFGTGDFTLSTGHGLPIPGFEPSHVGVAVFEHHSTDGLALLDDIIAVPEPSALVLLAIGAVVCLVRAFRPAGGTGS